MLGRKVTQWGFQNKGKSGWTGTSSFVLEVSLRYLRPSVIYTVPCDRIVQRAYCSINARGNDLSETQIQMFADWSTSQMAADISINVKRNRTGMKLLKHSYRPCVLT